MPGLGHRTGRASAKGRPGRFGDAGDC